MKQLKIIENNCIGITRQNWEWSQQKFWKI